MISSHPQRQNQIYHFSKNTSWCWSPNQPIGLNILSPPVTANKRTNSKFKIVCHRKTLELWQITQILGACMVILPTLPWMNSCKIKTFNCFKLCLPPHWQKLSLPPFKRILWKVTTSSTMILVVKQEISQEGIGI